MNSNLMKFAFVYLAGIGTYALVQNYNIIKKLNLMSGTEVHADVDEPGVPDTDSSDSPEIKALAAMPSAGSCACDDSHRYDVTTARPSDNIFIRDIPTCETMVHGANPGAGTPEGVGAWFSKLTLDFMFCNKPDANGIFVYKALNGKDVTYIIEAARTEFITSSTDGSSYIYYSRAMCPTLCGECMW